MGVPGEDAPGVLPARAFVNWYNGHPEYSWVGPEVDAALSSNPKAVIVGNGNVALDCARVLSKTPAELADSDMAKAAADVLARFQPAEHVSVVGRRGAAQAACTIKELRELTKLEASVCEVDAAELELGMTPASAEEVAAARPRKRLHKLFEDISNGASKGMTLPSKKILSRCTLRFLLQPTEVLTAPDGRAAGLRCVRTSLSGAAGAQRADPTGEMVDIDAGLVLRSIGYRSLPLEGLPFDAERGVALHEHGRCNPGLYVAGWLKRGPRGIIGTNIADAKETVKAVLEDAQVSRAANPKPQPEPKPKAYARA